MSADEFRVALERLGLSQLGAASFLGVHATTVRRWLTENDPHRIPTAVEMLLRVMVRDKMTTDDVLSIARTRLRA
jgi:hypothetical protein